ncbi:hypothetical protein CEXT_305671 [Caerostris extrusa]|uniref:Uncharacterized protein n=1 Tax=Caerostris extrusa TaxID=172846 RepID=A0AAV4WT69_CAEEX|nr:hypothetical protein CEXT_305671 [Caerostris extrusa]
MWRRVNSPGDKSIRATSFLRACHEPPHTATTFTSISSGLNCFTSRATRKFVLFVFNLRLTRIGNASLLPAFGVQPKKLETSRVRTSPFRNTGP